MQDLDEFRDHGDSMIELDNDMKREWVDLDMKVFLKHHRLTVDVDHGGLGTYDGGFLGLDDIDFGRLVHVLAQEIAAHDGKFQGVGLPDNAEIDFAVP